MSDLITQHLPQINALCRKYGVKRLELFGSGAREDFDPGTSDLDFLVLYDPAVRLDAAERFLGLRSDLQALFDREVDLVDIRGTRNPYFVAEALKHRVMLYAA
jgi:predicted nucleotidyltransferase